MRNGLRTSCLMGSLLCLIFSALAVAQVVTVTDGDISEAIRRDLRGDPGIKVTDLGVVTEKGIVTVSGRAGNLLVQRRILRKIEGTRGVRGVIDLLQVAPAQRPDAEIRQAVRGALEDAPALAEADIDVQAADAAVTLSGTVTSWTQKDLAGHLAMSIKGIQKVDNQLEVAPAPDRTDEQIMEEIQANLRYSAAVDHRDSVQVTVEEGRVVFSGSVGSVAERRALKKLGRVLGAREVQTDQVTVDPSLFELPGPKQPYAQPEAPQIRRAVEAALRQDPRIVSPQIEIEVEGQTVSLAGEVSTLAEKQAAEEDALHAWGVGRVINSLEVKPSDQPPTGRILQRARQRLAEDAILDPFEITVTVEDATVTLRGRVNSTLEKARAESLVAAIPGVTEVSNELEIRPPDAPQLTDQQIQEEIESQLFWDIFVDSDDIEVEVDNGIATLRGNVERLGELEAVVANAWEGGARGVQNLLTIRQASEATIRHYNVYPSWYYWY